MADIWEKTQKEWIKNLLLAYKPNTLPGKNCKVPYQRIVFLYDYGSFIAPFSGMKSYTEEANRTVPEFDSIRLEYLHVFIIIIC